MFPHYIILSSPPPIKAQFILLPVLYVCGQCSREEREIKRQAARICEKQREDKVVGKIDIGV